MAFYTLVNRAKQYVVLIRHSMVSNNQVEMPVVEPDVSDVGLPLRLLGNDLGWDLCSRNTSLSLRIKRTPNLAKVNFSIDHPRNGEVPFWLVCSTDRI
jgi:hypothetical protein